VTGTSSLSGNVGIGGDSGTETLLVTGSERVTSNLHVGGNLVVDGSFNFSEVIQNITTVNNEVILSTQLDISNQGTGPALKVSQFGVGDDQDVALFNAGDEGDAFKIDSSGNSHFYKEVNIVKENDVSFDTILIRRTDVNAVYMHLKTLQVYVNNVNILPSATNATQSIESGSLGDVIEFMTWHDLVAETAYISSGESYYASNIRNNNILSAYAAHSRNSGYISLYIPLTQSFNISDIQSFVLYNLTATSFYDRINGFQIELYNRSNGFTPGTNVLYSMPINTTAYVYRFDLPAIDTYTFGFSTTDSQTQIKDITVSASTQNFDTTLLKVEGGNTELGGNLSVSGTTRLNTLEVGNNVGITDASFDTIVLRRPTGFSGGNAYYINMKELQCWVNDTNILNDNSTSLISYFAEWSDKGTDIGNYQSVSPASNIYDNTFIENVISPNPGDVTTSNQALIIKGIPPTSLYNIQSLVFYNRTSDVGRKNRAIGLAIELYNIENDINLNNPVYSTGEIRNGEDVYRFDLPAITSYTGGFSTTDSVTQIKDITVTASHQNFDTTLLKVEGGDVSVGGVINQTGASWSLGGVGPNGTEVNLPYSAGYIPFSVTQTAVVNCIFDTDTITIQKSGKYLINFGAMSENNNSTVNIQLRKNSFNIMNAYEEGGSGYRMPSASTILSLEVNDIIRLYLETGTMHSKQKYRFFNGYLIG